MLILILGWNLAEPDKCIGLSNTGKLLECCKNRAVCTE